MADSMLGGAEPQQLQDVPGDGRPGSGGQGVKLPKSDENRLDFQKDNEPPSTERRGPSGESGRGGLERQQ